MIADVAREVRRLRSLERGSAHWEELLAAGLPEAELAEFVADGCEPKRAGCPRPTAGEFTRCLEAMFDLGGWVAGGGALARVFGTHRARDYDVFFDCPAAYARATLMSRSVPLLDVCFFSGRPWGSFDLEASMCAFRRTELDVSLACVDAVETGVSGLALENVADVRATVGRMAKYHGYFGVRFRRDHVLAALARGGADRAMAELAAPLCA